MAGRPRRLRNYGSASKYDHADIGFNSRLDELQAAFLRVKLAALGRWNARRREIAAAYERELADVPGLTLPPPDHESAWHVYCVRHLQRDALQAHLSACGVETLIHYPVACHRSGAFARGGWGSFPVAEEAARSVLSLPIGPHLGDDGVARVVRAVREFRA
jgi:dTDP-4-amino-4,6-dideoxygalactose transaminase